MSIPANDLVHWNIVNSALPEGLSYQGKHGTTQHGNGVWAPSIRYHDGIYWIFWGDILTMESIRSIPTAGEMTGSCISRTDMLTDVPGDG